MNKQKWVILAVTLLLMAGTGGLLGRLRAIQKLGAPGVKTSPMAGSANLQVDLPEHVAGYESQVIPVAQMVLDFLPKDTSFGQRVYVAADKFWVQVNVVLMGADRTSLHKPEFCLGGIGFNIDQAASSETTVHIERPVPYDLPVMKLVATKEVTVETNSIIGAAEATPNGPNWGVKGRKTPVRGIYVYWFVADKQYTARHDQRMWLMAKDMLRTGVLQRWAYVSYFAVCPPGAEDATFERMKRLMAASVPEFQLIPRPNDVTVSARQ